ncbi:hypothetical protein [Pseudoxanthomonas sp.]|uniref:hypothetical protein n=1 Tax=Pseudoxanthomonas sp. TaxID=1871049 RepID=UPI002638B29E|nr:hypothetical protein [Pseudoxanthomonas sp.]WDS37596.1 MAG: hypothetical protein O8I58_06920 [Pseudoxanthomonas sp.]
MAFPRYVRIPFIAVSLSKDRQGKSKVTDRFMPSIKDDIDDRQDIGDLTPLQWRLMCVWY